GDFVVVWIDAAGACRCGLDLLLAAPKLDFAPEATGLLARGRVRSRSESPGRYSARMSYKRSSSLCVEYEPFRVPARIWTPGQILFLSSVRVYRLMLKGSGGSLSR